MRDQLQRLGAEAEAVRGELRRRQRLEQVEARRLVRTRLATGEMPTIEQVMSADAPPGETRFDHLRCMRDSATEVRLGYASAAHQHVSFTDGGTTEDAEDLATARRLWREGWDFGTSAARGVRIYPVGSRAERVVPPGEVHVGSSLE
ncbi:MAG: hypothetical protein ABR598_07850 [Candidatus Dormibacteria bacterium]